MLRSLFSGITGLRAHQTMMDVVGNNIANVNSVGFKSSNVVFEDTLSQQLRSAGAPTPTTGGMNPAQVGLGVKIAGVNTNFTQGAAQLTGRSTDMMIQGDGFFVTQAQGQQLYTRAGAFSLDAQGNLTTPDGALVMGWQADSYGKLDTNASPSPVNLPVGTLLPPNATTSVTVGGNIPAETPAGTTIAATINCYDAQGTVHPLKASFTPVPDPADPTGATKLPNQWNLVADDNGSTVGTAVVSFDPTTGALTSPTSLPITFSGGATATVNLSGVTQYAGANTLAATDQNGSGMGSLQGYTISPDGVMEGVFSNGLKRPLAQIAMATFNNPPGMEKVGNSSYRATTNSGAAQIGVSGTGGRGLISGGALEMSNVDLAAEFTQLIVSERGFQANSRVITSADEILQDLVNLKR